MAVNIANRGREIPGCPLKALCKLAVISSLLDPNRLLSSILLSILHLVCVLDAREDFHVHIYKNL